MKNTELMKTFTRTVNKVGFQVRKYSPEILVVAGVAGVVVSAVAACKATLKVNDVLKEHKETVEKIHEVANNPEMAEKYSEEDCKKDLTATYIHTGWEMVKLYGPSVALGAVSVTSIVASNQILRKRNVALAAAYATVEKGFKEYRGRVVERFGEHVDRELKYNIKAKEIEEVVVDEDGKENVVKRTINTADVSGYARFFEEYTRDEKGNLRKNMHWDRNNEYNVMFLNAQQRYANDLLRSRGRLFLNDVYDMLDLPRSKEGQIVGWVYDEKNSVGDNYIDFGLHRDSQNYSDFVYGNDEAILLDFNVDGNIWEMM